MHPATGAFAECATVLVTAGTPAATACIVWRHDNQVTLVWRDWGADSVCYDARSGHTHQLSPLAAAVMACIEQAPADWREVAQRLELLPAPSAAAAAEVESTLQAVFVQLRDLGWLRPASPS